MTGKERFLAAFAHQEPDRVPLFEQTVVSSVASQILGRPALTGGVGLFRDQAEAWLKGEQAYEEFLQQVHEDRVALARKLGLDALSGPWLGGGRPTCKVGENDYLYGEPDGVHHVCHYDPHSNTWGTAYRSQPVTHESVRQTVRDLDAEPPRPGPESFQSFHRYRRLVGDELEILGGAGMSIPLQQPWLEMVALDPGVIAAYIDYSADRMIAGIEVQAELGIKVIWGGGDMADNHGPTYSPRAFREIMMPRWQRVTRRCRELGVHYVFRSDGNLWPLADEIFEQCGFDGYGEIDHEAGMALADLKRRYPHLTFWGGISCGTVLYSGTAEEVAAAARRAIDQAGRGGGFVLGSSNSVLHGTPPENVFAYAETAKTYGRYPLGT